MPELMTIEAILETLPEYAKDLRLNWSSLANATELTDNQKWGCFVAAAYGARSPQLLAAVEAEAAAHVSPEVINAAKGAAAIMGMNNIYYRFHHLTTNEKYATLPARLRMNIMRTPWRRSNGLRTVGAGRSRPSTVAATASVRMKRFCWEGHHRGTHPRRSAYCSRGPRHGRRTGRAAS